MHTGNWKCWPGIAVLTSCHKAKSDSDLEVMPQYSIRMQKNRKGGIALSDVADNLYTRVNCEGHFIEECNIMALVADACAATSNKA